MKFVRWDFLTPFIAEDHVAWDFTFVSDEVVMGFTREALCCAVSINDLSEVRHGTHNAIDAAKVALSETDDSNMADIRVLRARFSLHTDSVK